MTRARSLFLAPATLLLCVASFGCQAAGPQRPVRSALDPRASERDAEPEPVTAVLDLTEWSEETAAAGDEAREPELDFIEETVVSVDEDTAGDSARALRFVPVMRGGETLGVRVFFEPGAEDGDDDTYLGLRPADRIEEVDGLPVASLDALLQAWYRVGWLPEVRFSISRAGRMHTVIYRRRTPGMAASW